MAFRPNARWLIGIAMAGAVLLGIMLSGPVTLAHDDVHGRPHFKGLPAAPTAVMRALEAATKSPQSLAAVSNVSCTGGFADIYPCQNVDLLAFVPLADMGNGGQLGGSNDVWGWTHQASGREFALIGLKDGTGFVEITDPVNPVILGNLPTHTSASTWRDIKVYADHAFIVSQASGHGMQVFDLTKLLSAAPNTTFTDDAQYSGFGGAHNVVINEASGFAYAVGTGTCSGGLHIVDISDPLVPTSAGCFSSDGYSHDAQCVIYNGPDTEHQGKEICLNSNEDTLTIVDLTDKGNPIQLSRKSYPGDGYTHQGWLTPDHAYFLLDDELDEYNFGHNTRTRIFDVSDLDSPFVTSSHDSTVGAIDHNQYVKGNVAYQANYRAGLRVLKISGQSPPQLLKVGFFDIYPDDDNADFNGAWSNYPYFNSGVVVVSGIEQGLFILRPNLTDDPPTVTVVAPGSNATVGGTVAIDAAAGDDLGVDQVEFFVDGISIGIDTDGTEGWSVDWITPATDNGVPHNLTATATDTTNQSTSHSIRVVVDNVIDVNSPPVATDDGALTPANTPKIIAVLDNDSDANGDSLSVINLTQPANGTAVANGDGTVTYTPDAIFAGPNDSFTYQAWDGQAASNIATVTVTISNDTPPTNVAITSPSPGPVSGNIRIEATATDDVGVTQVEFFAGTKSLGVDTDGSNGWKGRWNANKESDGDYDVWARATDTIGQSGESAMVAVTVGSSDGSDPGGGPNKCRPKKDCP